jgi:hypothetical protein
MLRRDSLLEANRSRKPHLRPQYRDRLGLGPVAPAIAALARFLAPDHTRLRLQRFGSWLRNFK